MNLRKWVTVSFVTAAVSASSFGGVFAQDVSESHLSAARQAVSAIQATDRFDAILPNIALGLKGDLIANNPDIEEAINEIVDSETLALVSRRADLEIEAAESYAKAMSEEHLLAIAEFYQSDAGKALLQNGPIVARSVEEAAAIWQRGIQRDLTENVGKKLDEVIKREAPAEATEGTEPVSE